SAEAADAAAIAVTSVATLVEGDDRVDAAPLASVEIGEDATQPLTGDLLGDGAASEPVEVVGVHGQAENVGAPVAGSFGTLTLAADGSYAYVLDGANPVVQGLGVGESLSDSFVYSLADVHGNTASHALNVTIVGANDAPVIGAVDLGTTLEDQALLITADMLLANSHDIDGDALTVVEAHLADPAAGTLIANGDGTWTFTPTPDLSGSGLDIAFSVSDGHALATGHAIWDMAPVNDAPEAIALDNLSVSENAAGAAIGVLSVSDVDDSSHVFALSDARFEVVTNAASDAVLKLKDGISLDYEAEPTVPLSITATDAAGAALTQDFTIAVADGLDIIEGTNRADVLTGNAGPDRIIAKNGPDTVTAGGGDDVIIGGRGNDTLDGGAGDDVFEVGARDGFDVFQGGAGNDRVAATADNVAIGVAGDFGAANGIETISANGYAGVTVKGDNTGSRLDFSATALDGIAAIDGGGGHDTIIGTAFDDVIIGGRGNDTLDGGAGDDRIEGGPGRDTAVFSGDRADYFVADNGDGSYAVRDLVAGRDGTDTVVDVESFTFADGTWTLADLLTSNPNLAPDAIALDNLSVSENAAGAAIGVLSVSDVDDSSHVFALSDARFEVVTNAAGDAVLKLKDGISLDYEAEPTVPLSITATDAAGNGFTQAVTLDVVDVPGVVLTGSGQVVGTGEADTLSGSQGADWIEGGAGDDVLMWTADGLWANGNAAWNNETGETAAIGGYNQSHDVFRGGEGHDTLVATDGNDAVFLAATNLPFYGGQAVPRLLDVETIDLGAGDDVLDMVHTSISSTDDVTALGGLGNDVIWTDQGNDWLDGGAGNDRLYGGQGDDVLVGGQGDDVLDGGQGDDLFLLASGDGNDQVHGGTGWTDSIDISAMVAEGMSWTLMLDEGASITQADPGAFLLSADASGHISFSDGSELIFDGIERIVW
ncbi:MAG: hypothetical protein D6782_02480, partial [Alphaproteobacteria bacterium]